MQANGPVAGPGNREGAGQWVGTGRGGGQGVGIERGVRGGSQRVPNGTADVARKANLIHEQVLGGQGRDPPHGPLRKCGTWHPLNGWPSVGSPRGLGPEPFSVCWNSQVLTPPSLNYLPHRFTVDHP